MQICEYELYLIVVKNFAYFTMLTRKATKLHEKRRNKYLICVLWMLSLYLTSILRKASNIFLDANDAWQCYRATDIFISLSIFFGLLVSNLRLGYKTTLNSSTYAKMWLWALLEQCWQGKPQSYIRIEETSIWYVCYKCDYYT